MFFSFYYVYICIVNWKEVLACLSLLEENINCMKEVQHIISSDKHEVIQGATRHFDLTQHKEYYLFNLSGGRKKVKVLLYDILLVRAIKGGHADKLIYLKGNVSHLIRGHSLNELINITSFLLQCNKQDLVSLDAVDYVEEDSIYLNGVTIDGKPIFVTLNRTYRKSFLTFFHYSQRV